MNNYKFKSLDAIISDILFVIIWDEDKSTIKAKEYLIEKLKKNGYVITKKEG